MSKKSPASVDRQKVIRQVLRQFVAYERGGFATPEEMASKIADQAFEGVADDAFRFPETIKVVRKLENSN